MAQASTKHGSASALAQARTLIGQFKAARKCSTPLVAVQTPDQFATVSRIIAAVTNSTPFITWDVVRGFEARNPEGVAAMTKVCQNGEDAAGHLVPACKMAANLPPNTVLFIYNAQRHLDDGAQVQSVSNLRDQFKQDRRTLVLMGPHVALPVELQSDVVTLDEPLPDSTELAKIVKDLHQSAQAECPPEKVHLAVEAVQGLSAFAAEQVTAMSMNADQATKEVSLDIPSLWERKRQQVEQTQGLTVDRFNQTFADIGGLEQAKKFGTKLFSGPRRPAVVCRIEEIEKVMAGSQGDTSGVSQDALQVILNSMEDHNWSGIIAYGPPGSGKSLYSKALAATFGAFSCALDLGAARGSLVGQSEAAIRTAMKVIHSIGGENVFFVATANRLETMPPELRRRFRYGVWMFDAPDAAERKVIWKLCKDRYSIPAKDALVDDDGLTGADIRNVCELAYSLRCPLQEASEFIAPICKTSPQVFEESRRIADGRFLSASVPGLFRVNKPQEFKAAGRRFDDAAAE